jgi:hypothetical protein
MSDVAVRELLYLLDQSFDANDEHSLMANLKSVRIDDWLWKPAGGHRSIRRLAEHAGTAYYAYGNHLFGDATQTYQGLIATAPSAQTPDAMRETFDWIARGYGEFREGLAALDDGQLGAPTKTHYGEVTEVRFAVGVVIGHAIYHGGEINHIRALHQGNDAWWPEFVQQA